jgi:hypothetical protein
VGPRHLRDDGELLPAVARGAEEAPPALREWAVKLEAKPKYVVSSTRKDFPWTNTHHIGGDLRAGVQRLKDATPKGVLLGSGTLATELDRLELIDEYLGRGDGTGDGGDFGFGQVVADDAGDAVGALDDGEHLRIGLHEGRFVADAREHLALVAGSGGFSR